MAALAHTPFHGWLVAILVTLLAVTVLQLHSGKPIFKAASFCNKKLIHFSKKWLKKGTTNTERGINKGGSAVDNFFILFRLIVKFCRPIGSPAFPMHTICIRVQFV